MKKALFMVVILIGLSAITSSKAEAANALLPVKVSILNLTSLDYDTAIKACNELNLECPAIRKRDDKEKHEYIIKKQG